MRINKIGIIIAIFSFALLSSSAFIQRVKASAYTPYILLSNYDVQPGQNILVSGNMFAPNETVNIGFNGGNISTTTNVYGRFTQNLNPGNLPAGKYSINTTGSTSGVTSKITFSVQGYYPNITPSSYYIQRDQGFSVKGTGFAPNEIVNLSFDGKNNPVRADGNGNVSWNLTTPRLGGNFPMIARGAYSSASSSRTLTVAGN